MEEYKFGQIGFFANSLSLAQKMLDTFIGEFKINDLDHIQYAYGRKTYFLKDGRIIRAYAAKEGACTTRLDIACIHPNVSKCYKKYIISMLCSEDKIIEYDQDSIFLKIEINGEMDMQKYKCHICGKERDLKVDKGFKTDICGECVEAYKKAAANKAENIRLQERWDTLQEALNQDYPIKWDADVRDGKTKELWLKGPIARLFIQQLVGLFIDSGAENYLAVDFHEKGSIRGYTVTIQQKQGLTPAQKNTKLEAEIATLRKMCNSSTEDESIYGENNDRI